MNALDNHWVARQIHLTKCLGLDVYRPDPDYSD